jgi:carboxymethylenebutenolidase
MSSMTVKATDGSGSFDAYVVEPTRTPAGAMVLIQEIFGVNDSMKYMACQVADLGFIAVVPDLFWRLQPGVNLTDKSEAEWKQAFDLMNRFDQDKGIEDLKATLAAARALPGCNGRAGTMGYCLGGRLAFMMATRSDSDVNVSYYGVGIDGLLGELPNVHKPLLIHIAALDKYVPPEAQAKIAEATLGDANVQTYIYANADHAFARANGTHWHGLSAAIANGRSAEALGRALGG